MSEEKEVSLNFGTTLALWAIAVAIYFGIGELLTTLNRIADSLERIQLRMEAKK